MLLRRSQRAFLPAESLVGEKGRMRFALPLHPHKESVSSLFLLVNPANAWCSFRTFHSFYLSITL